MQHAPHIVTEAPTLGSTTAAYDFGGLAVAVQSTDETWLGLVEARYRHVRRTERSFPDFLVRFEPAGEPPDDLVSPLAAHAEHVDAEPIPGGFRATTTTTCAEVDLTAGRAVLRGPAALYPLDNLLIHLLPVLKPRNVLFHSAALDLGGTGLLACGPSGAGKSTLARLAGERALCDEVADVQEEASGFRLLSLPFCVSRTGSASLSAVLLLGHGAAHRLAPVDGSEALRELCRLVLWPVAHPEVVGRTLSRLAAVVESVPVFRLWFAPRTDVVDFLKERLP